MGTPFAQSLVVPTALLSPPSCGRGALIPLMVLPVDEWTQNPMVKEKGLMYKLASVWSHT